LRAKNYGEDDATKVIGLRQKQASGRFGEASLQQVFQDFQTIALHHCDQPEHEERKKP
jgi:hypothetical protein